MMDVLPFVENDGIKIHYEVEGEGAPLMLHHGRTMNGNFFRYFGYTERLSQEYQLILIDSRGHGRSDKPHEPEAYRLKSFVDDTVAVLDELDIESSHFLGYSMGGWVGLGIGVYSPDRFRSLIIGGMGKEESNSEATIESQRRSIEGYRKGHEALFAEVEHYLKELPPEVYAALRADHMSLDLEALTAMRSLNEYVGFDEALPTLELPCLFYVGERDGWYQRAKRTAEIIPNARFVSFPGLSHVDGFNRSDLVLPHVLKFLDEQGK